MSNLARLSYNNINIDFSRFFNRFMIENSQFRVRDVTLSGRKKQINFFNEERLKIVKRVLSRTFENQLLAFWEYVKSGQTFTFRWDRDLLAYISFENVLTTNDAVAGTLTRATTGTYVNPATGLLVTAASGAARHPAGKFGLGFLAEKAATNILLRSEEFDNASWTATTLTVTAGTTETKDPAGGTASEKCVPSAATGTLRQDTSTAIGTDDAAFSIWIKGGSSGATSATIDIIRADTSAVLATSTVTVTTSWQRFQVGYNSTGSIAANWGVIITLSGSGERFYLFGAQLEAGGRFATSYIATTSAAVTRNADQLAYAATAIFDDEPRQGSIGFWFASEFTTAEIETTKSIFSIQGVINTYFLHVYYVINQQIFVDMGTKQAATSQLANDTAITYARNEFHYVVVTWDFDTSNAFKFYFDGVLQDTGSLLGYAPDRIGTNLRIGFNATATEEACGVIDDVEIRRDVLTAAEILARYNMNKALGWRRNYWSSLMIDDDAYAPELLVGGYRWGMELNFVEQK